MRNEGWEELISKVIKIYNKHDIDVFDMHHIVFNLNHFKNNCLFSVLDLQLHELNVTFGEENIEFLQYVSSLSPAKSFAVFYVKKLLRMTEFYPNDFTGVPDVALHHQLRNYVTNQLQRLNVCFSAMKVLKSNLCNKMSDQLINNRLVTYIKRDVLLTISNDVIFAHF
ncbi:general transcription factor-like zinc finger protein, putative [Medicago truncatula]|uniref:General transcription factor-like zinc finger protein, putative n=1 Tax=Medicago truncatula TaxID=3880 RepID=G7J7C2_MEDTR|nr:general transcription factor-like zinc finger protein, putative [Medicago truncatula]